MNTLKKFINYENSDFIDEEEVLTEETENEQKLQVYAAPKDTRTISLRLRFSAF